MIPALFASLLFLTAAMAQESAAPVVDVVLLDQMGNSLPVQAVKKVIKTDEEWRAQLGER